MDLTEYPASQLKVMAQAAARENGGRLVRWSVTVTENREIVSGIARDIAELRVYYQPRHWRHCPGCQDVGAKTPHVGPKGEPVKELETATVAL